MSYLVTLALFLTTAMIGDPQGDDPDIRQAYSGKIVGLVDLHSHQIIGQAYSRIDYLGHGLYLAWGLNKVDPLSYGAARSLFTKGGKRLTPCMPAESELVQICSFGAAADKNVDLVLDQLPADALLRFRKAGKFGLCSPQGKIALEPKYDFIGKASEGKCFVSYKSPKDNNYVDVFVFDTATKNLRAWPFKIQDRHTDLVYSDGLVGTNGDTTKNEGFGFVNLDGDFVIKPKYGYSEPFKNGMAVVQEMSRDPRGGPTHAIDKTGKDITPSNLKLQFFFGDLAIASIETPAGTKFGVVDRHFKFVVPPKFDNLAPVWRETDKTFLDRVGYSFESTPAYFTTSIGMSQKLISNTGAILVEPPENYILGLIFDDVVFCHSRTLDSSNPQQRKFYRIPTTNAARAYSDADVAFISTHSAIGPERFLTERNADDGKFNSNYWSTFATRPITRVEMFRRFLKEYDLIGMSRAQLLQLLAVQDPTARTNNAVYMLLENGCGWGSSLCINLKDDKVVSYTINTMEMGTTEETIDTNCLLELGGGKRSPDSSRTAYHFVPKPSSK